MMPVVRLSTGNFLLLCSSQSSNVVWSVGHILHRNTSSLCTCVVFACRERCRPGWNYEKGHLCGRYGSEIFRFALGSGPTRILPRAGAAGRGAGGQGEAIIWVSVWIRSTRNSNVKTRAHAHTHRLFSRMAPPRQSVECPLSLRS